MREETQEETHEAAQKHKKHLQRADTLYLNHCLETHFKSLK